MQLAKFAGVVFQWICLDQVKTTVSNFNPSDDLLNIMPKSSQNFFFIIKLRSKYATQPRLIFISHLMCNDLCVMQNNSQIRNNDSSFYHIVKYGLHFELKKEKM